MSTPLKVASKHGPAITLRFRSKKEMDDVRRAALHKGLSFNTYVLEMLKVAVKETVNGDQR